MAWLKWFDSQTRPKAEAAGCKRILHIDGHKTHTALEVDDYAAENGIILLGYPPKTSHALQGLDRVHFARVKILWGSEVQRLEEALSVEEVRKEHILRVLHSVWQKVFTAENNRKAFETTGLTRPVQPDQLSSRMTAPSVEFSTTQSSLPLPPSTPVQQAARIIDIVADLQAAARTSSDSEHQTPTRVHAHLSHSAQDSLEISPVSMKIDPALFTPGKRAKAVALHLYLAHVPVSPGLSNPSERLSPILAPDPPSPSSRLNPSTPLPPDAEDLAVLHHENETLRHQLKAAQAAVADRDSTIRSQNAQLLIQDGHCMGLQKRLNAKGKRKQQSQVSRYLRDGGERVYTADGFRAAVRADREDARRKKLDQVRSAALAAAKKDRVNWRTEQLDARRKENTQGLKSWEAQCADCEADGTRKPPKPKRAAKAKTPPRFEEAINKAGTLTRNELERLENNLEGVEEGETRRQILLQALHGGLPSLTDDSGDSETDDPGLGGFASGSQSPMDTE